MTDDEAPNLATAKTERERLEAALRVTAATIAMANPRSVASLMTVYRQIVKDLAALPDREEVDPLDQLGSDLDDRRGASLSNVTAISPGKRRVGGA